MVRRRKPIKIKGREKKEIRNALNGSLRTLKLLNRSYDEGDFQVSRDICAVMHRAVFAEMKHLGVRSKTKFADSTGVSLEPSVIEIGGKIIQLGELVSPFSPFVGTSFEIKRDPPYILSPLRSADEFDLTDPSTLTSSADPSGGSKPILEWVSFDAWRTQIIFREPKHLFEKRSLIDPAATRFKIKRESFINGMRNEIGAHYDSMISETLFGVDGGHFASYVTVEDGKVSETYSGISQQPSSCQDIANTEGRFYISNTPKDAMSRGLAGEVVLTLEQLLKNTEAD